MDQTMKKIGEYLVENDLCDESLLEEALRKQAELREEGVVKLLGTVLTESQAISQDALDKVIVRMLLNILSSTHLFQSISDEVLKETLAKAHFRVLPEDTVIFNQGDEPESFVIIISGKVRIFSTSPDNHESTIAYFGGCEAFGEVSLLTGELHSASAKTVKQTSLLEFTKKEFHSLIESHPDISLALLKGLAGRLNRREEEIVQANEKEKAYQQFVSQESELSLPDLIGQTRTINNLRKKIHEAAENESPALIQGESGTEKLVVAGTIHKNSERSSAPFLSMDAENVVLEGYGAIPEEDSGTLQLEMAQGSVLFGYEKGAFAFSQSRGLGLLHICRTGTVVIENVDKLTKGTQQKLHDFLVKGTFETIGGQRPISSSARIIATTSKDLDELAEQGLFDQPFLQLLKSNDMAVPPIKKRKSDLRLLVDFLIIMECFKTPDRKLIKGISPEAYQRIMEYDWPGNMDELQIVVRRAINLAQGEYLMPEDIFIGIAPPEGKYTFNLLKLEKVRDFFTSRFYPAGIQLMTGAFFSLIFLFAFMGSQSPDSNVTLLLVWALWWPMLAISWFFGARIWCSVCPMGAVNDLLNKVCSLKKKVPKFIRDNSMYLSAAGLALIIYVEASSGMTNSPKATGFLLASILACAVISGLLYERRVWCRYLCPLGRLAATFSGCSIIEWRSNSSICNSTCKTNACYKGNEKVAGCPLYQGPFSLQSNQDCILCGNCVKICENASPAFNIRIPGHELWAALQPEKITSVFVPVILGTQLFRGLEYTPITHSLESVMHSTWAAYALLLLLATVASFIFVRGAGTITFGPLINNSINKGELFINGLIPLVFGFEIAYQFKPLLERLGHFMPVFGRQFGFDLEFLDFAARNGAAKPWQVLIVFSGMVTSMIFLKILIRNHQEKEEGILKPKQLRYVPILFLAGVFIWMFVAA